VVSASSERGGRGTFISLCRTCVSYHRVLDLGLLIGRFVRAHFPSRNKCSPSTRCGRISDTVNYLFLEKTRSMYTSVRSVGRPTHLKKLFPVLTMVSTTQRCFELQQSRSNQIKKQADDYHFIITKRTQRTLMGPSPRTIHFRCAALHK